MEVTELDPARANVDIPIGGAGGECNVSTFLRDNNTLTLNESSNQQIGICTVQVDVMTVLTFFADDTVAGFEIDRLSEAGGDCSGLALPCELQLDLNGSRCTGCFSCVLAPLATDRLRWGPFANGAGM
jgi:hypothetical protein